MTKKKPKWKKLENYYFLTKKMTWRDIFSIMKLIEMWLSESEMGSKQETFIDGRGGRQEPKGKVFVFVQL